jgi:hypothetical protein
VAASGPAYAAWNKAGTAGFSGAIPISILISRILHRRMLPEKHAIDDEEA